MGTPASMSGVSGTTYYGCVQGLDLAGNTSGWIPSVSSITVDMSAPTVTQVSASTADNHYRRDDVISIQVQFSETVYVTNETALALLLETGSTDHAASFSTGSGTNTLTFAYTVQTGDSSSDLEYQSLTALSTGAGTIRDASGNNATLTLPALGSANSLGGQKAIRLDTTAPAAPSGVGFPGPYSNATAFSMSWTAGTDSNFSTHNVKICTSNDCSTGCSGAATSLNSPAAMTGVNGTAYYGCVQSLDLAGNSSAWIASAATLTVDTTPPTVNAGSDLTATSTTGINATTGGATSHAWTKVSGPGTITFSAPSSEDTNVSASADGIYVLRLTATDAAGNSFSDDLNFVWDTTVPTVSVGADLTVNATTGINATTSGASSWAWSQVSGPGTITFSAPSAEDTNASASADGTYVLRLTATDAAGNSFSDDLNFNWDTTAPAATISGAPSGTSSSTALNITIAGTGVSNYRYALYAGSTSCSSATFSISTPVSTQITDDISGFANGTVTLCVIGLDSLGNQQAPSSAASTSWNKQLPLAGQPSNVSAIVQDSSLILNWTGSGSTSGFLILRSTSAVTSTPTNGTVYTAGNTIGSATVAYVGATNQYTNTGLTNNTVYHYKIFAYDATTTYSTGTAVSAKPQVCAGTSSSPTEPSYTQITSGKTRAYVNWGEGGSNTTGYLVLRQASYTVCDLAVNGTSYNIGDFIGTSRVVYNGSLNGFNEASLTNDTTYHYRAFAYTSTSNYSKGNAMSVIPKNWTLLNTLTTLGTNTNGNRGAQYPVVENGILYMSLEENGLGTYTLQTSPTVSLIAGATRSFPSNTYLDFLDKKGAYVYATVLLSGFYILDASSPLTSLPTVGSLPITRAEGVLVDGNYAYVTGRDLLNGAANGGLHVIDVTNKASPVEVGSHGTAGCIGTQVQKFNHYVYVSCRYISPSTWQGILVYDVSDPSTPTMVKSFAKHSAEGLRVVGNYLVASTRPTSTSPSLEIYDLTNPADPALVGSTTWTGGDDAVDVTVLGDYAFVSNFTSRTVTAIDISNPVSPAVSRAYSFATNPIYLNHDGQNIIVSTNSKGFRWEKVFQ
ncbi:MAG TPA: hypothetical protein VE954_11895 [Oligoflexus sp.]|uniref:PKD domain-containing protein n=1 Tax=Oligoflexus sp. TaxID=1971216 RepID=UPI002D26C231|nr:hypothetical protein [Oligoflexus sp.]HYX33807.1 hypothetical protein [Oligoflexus sp.]